MAYTAPTIIELGTVRDMTLQANDGNGSPNGKKQMSPDGVSGNDGKGVLGSVG